MYRHSRNAILVKVNLNRDCETYYICTIVSYRNIYIYIVIHIYVGNLCLSHSNPWSYVKHNVTLSMRDLYYDFHTPSLIPLNSMLYIYILKFLFSLYFNIPIYWHSAPPPHHAFILQIFSNMYIYIFFTGSLLKFYVEYTLLISNHSSIKILIKIFPILIHYFFTNR